LVPQMPGALSWAVAGSVAAKSRPSAAMTVRPRRAGPCVMSVQPVERFGIVPQDLVDGARPDAVVVAQEAQRLDLARAVGMAVIGADDEIVLAGDRQHIGQIVGHLAGDIDIVGGQYIVRQPLAAPLEAAA